MKRNILFTFLVLISLSALCQDFKKLELESNLSREAKEYPKYWKSTGFSPADLLDYPDMEMTLDYLKASGSIEFIRPHYLLDHIRISAFATENQETDWAGLDSKLDKVVGAKLKLIFEIMGNPADREIDFADDSDLFAWKNFVRDLAIHYMDRYGKEVVESWYFETSNEPDLEHFWKHGMVKFLNYYDACSEGLLEANPNIRFGGPGTARGASDTFKLLLEHCAWGRNYFTGEKGVRIDFVSTHRKNIPHQMIEDELLVWKYMEEAFPSMCSSWPVMNDEADPIAGWGIPYYWRTGPWYGAFILQAVELHNRLIVDSICNDYLLLSNDHGFLGSWGKRTQLARFIPGDNDQVMRGASGTGGGREVSVSEDTRDRVNQFYLIKKPSLTVMSMMELFGESRFDVKGMNDQLFPNAGAIVTQNRSGDLILALYNKPEMDLRMNKRKPTMVAPEEQLKLLSDQALEISLDLQGLEDGEYKLIHYSFDEIHSHAYHTWLQMGSPEDPSLEQYRELSASMEPEIIESGDVLIKDSFHQIKVPFPSSGVSFILMVTKGEKPEKVTGLSHKLYKGLNGEDMIMLTWDKASGSGLRSYEVYARGLKDKKYHKVNQANILASGFAHAIPDAEGYRYKVRVVDYWDREGAFSNELLIDH